MIRRSLVAFALGAAFATSAYSQTRQEALNAIRGGDLSKALSKASALTNGKSATAADFQLRGLLLVAQGRTGEALDAFQAGLSRPQGQDQSSGLDTLPPDNALSQRLALVKGLFATSVGEAAFRNNIGLVELMRGRMKEGFEQLSNTSRLAPNFGAAYVNLAVGHLLKREGSKAVNAAKKGVDLGETSVIARAVLAESDIIVNRLTDAGDQLKLALEADGDNPIVLAARAKLAAAKGDMRAAQRYRSQALAGGAPIAVDGALEPSYTKGQGSGGTAHEDHYAVDQRLFQADPTGLGLNFKTDSERVQNRGSAFQTLSAGGAEIASALGALHVDYNDLNGGRPGTAIFEPGVPSDPTSNLTFRQTNVYGNIKSGGITFHAGYRGSLTNMDNGTTTASAYGHDAQFRVEARRDTKEFGGKTTSGIAFTRLDRITVNGLPIDPTEELLPAGRTELWTAYALHTRDLNPFIRLSFGGTIGRNGSAIVGEPYVDLALHLGSKNVAHIGVAGAFNSDVSDLMPDQLLAPSVLENPVDRNQDTTTPYNQNPLMLTQQGRQRSYTLNLQSIVSPKVTLNTGVYHHQLKDVTVQGTDPQTATTLNPNQLSSGSASGVSETVQVKTSPNSSLRAKLYVQHTSVTPLETFYNANQPGSPAPLNLPYAPGVGLDLGLNLGGGDWASSLTANTLGRRTVATAEPMGDGTYCCSYIQVVNPVTSWNLFLHKQAGPLNLYLALYNLTRVSFYPGDPGHTTIVFGFQL